jgi:hypothetical protein
MEVDWHDNTQEKTSSQTITKLLYKNKSYTDKANIAHQLNTH